MENFLLKIIATINMLNESISTPMFETLKNLNLEHWLMHSIVDCVKMLPFLFVIFLTIEIIEAKYYDKIIKIAKFSKKTGPIIGSLVASLPQCGFSVIASTLYVKKCITKGTLIAVFVATSDEAIPVLMATPESIKLVLPLLITKIAIAVTAGFIVDMFTDNKKILDGNKDIPKYTEAEGCHKHHLTNKKASDIILHPLNHTLSVFIFILIVTVGINYMIHISGGVTEISKYLLGNTILQPIAAAIVGLVPSCAISVGFTLLYTNGGIGFGSLIAGLCSSAGLGTLVLFRKNENIKDTAKIIFILLVISIIAGILIQICYN